MRLVFGLVLVIGLGLAGFAVYMAKNYIGAYQAELARERAVSAKAVKTVGVYVINKPVKYGEKLTTEDVTLVAWPQKALPEGIFTDQEPLFAEGETRPRYALRAMEKFEPVLAVKVTAPGEDAGLTSRLGKGMRAFAIKVDVASGVSGFLRPGDKVDIYWTGRAPGSDPAGRKEDVTRLIETNVSLIAIDQTATSEQSEASIANTVTVAVSPQQVAALAQAQATGRLALSLVGTDDETVAEVIEVDQRKLLGIVAEEQVEAKVIQEKKVCTTRVNKGTEKVEIEIPCTN
ncbi:Flp pilus assembly protein CpaB [Pseudaestuariivita atlantica]|uniref:Pilus assembly protein CpaB n=1 Tax=Pseudaestuariivita atlantica TaxID=1317121 RepID=A0A0L1JTR9_9RHOB|nr:Flp pilus assembly protein CpaB [Pseudaestuariivita atlantica]KNG94808.1 pilus assembly protein CpaB [Pseudaestuariivita atlantica]